MWKCENCKYRTNNAQRAAEHMDKYDHECMWYPQGERKVCPHENCGYGECSWLQGGTAGACDVHGNNEGRCQKSQPQQDQPEKSYLVCDNCGEAFDSIDTAQEHGHSDLSGSAGWCGDNGFSIVPESEAF